MACKEITAKGERTGMVWCTTHYRRWRSGQPMNAPITRYAKRVRPKREKPFRKGIRPCGRVAAAPELMSRNRVRSWRSRRPAPSCPKPASTGVGPPSWHSLSPGDMAVVLKGFRRVTVAIPVFAIAG
jgi:hypothetical protein